MGVDAVAEKYLLPDLHAAPLNYIGRVGDSEQFVSVIGGRHVAHSDHPLPFNRLEVWTRV